MKRFVNDMCAVKSFGACTQHEKLCWTTLACVLTLRFRLRKSRVLCHFVRECRSAFMRGHRRVRSRRVGVLVRGRERVRVGEKGEAERKSVARSR